VLRENDSIDNFVDRLLDSVRTLPIAITSPAMPQSLSLSTEIHTLVSRLRQAILLASALASALMAVVPCLAEGLVWPPITEPPTSQYAPGKWVWAELFTEDVKAAVRFYGKAFDWSFKEFPAARGPGYTLALSEGEPVGGLLQRDHSHEKERGSRWLGMISVPDVKAAARYAARGDVGLCKGIRSTGESTQLRTSSSRPTKT